MEDTVNNYRHVPIIESDPIQLVDLPCETGEGPLWDREKQSLTWNDIPAGTLYRYTPASRSNIVEYQHNTAIGGHTLQKDGSLVIFSEHGQILLLQNGDVQTIIASIPEVAGSRFNDVGADPAGRVFCGTMPLTNGPARLYRLDTDGSIHLVWDDLGLSNGIGFSPDEKTFYLSDSDHRVVYRADYDHATGSLSNREVLIRLDDDHAVPDGMTVDANGDLWLAVWNGGCVLHYSATGEIIDKIMVPALKASSINFGGHNFDTAFITTAGGSNRTGDDGPMAGSLFGVTIPGVRGKADFRSNISLT